SGKRHSLTAKSEGMARVTGLEPATSGVTGRHSNQLSYTRVSRPRSSASRRGASFRRGRRELSSEDDAPGGSFSSAPSGSRRAAPRPGKATDRSQEKPLAAWV